MASDLNEHRSQLAAADDAADAVTALHESHSVAWLTASQAPESRRGSLVDQEFIYDVHYNMSHKNRGYAVIFNQVHFHKDLKLDPRNGSNVDAQALEKAFTDLGFEDRDIHVVTDVKLKDMIAGMQYYARADYSDKDCFMCAILSHGKDNGLIYASDGVTTVDQLLQPFKTIPNPTLIGKPKIFLIQACRGTKFDDGMDFLETDDPEVHRIAVESDFLCAFSTIPGYYSWRNSTRGSWFIQSFARAVEKYRKDPDTDLLKILTRANYEVSYRYQSNVPADASRNMKKQMPSFVSMLTKDVYFFRR